MGHKKQKRYSTDKPTNKMSKNTKQIKQVKGIEGLFSCTLEHAISETKLKFEWSGPKIGPDVWNQVLAFFKWTQVTTQSESQVRLFVNHRTQQWRAWAFPQKAKTGMTTKEVDTPETITQRAQFSDTDGWLYFGTVHHHCTASAFQSGVDTENEKGQDGVHITVGFMDKPHHDIHYRFYLYGIHFTDFKIITMWDIGNCVTSLPAVVQESLPKDFDDKMARHQMGVPPPVDYQFPEQWKANLIFEQEVVRQPMVHVIHSGNSGRYWQLARKLFMERSCHEIPYDGNKVKEQVLEWLESNDNVMRTSLEDVIMIFDELDRCMGDDMLNLTDIILHNDVRPDFAAKVLREYLEEQLQKELEQEDKRIAIALGAGGSMAEQQMLGEGAPLSPHDSAEWFPT